MRVFMFMGLPCGYQSLVNWWEEANACTENLGLAPVKTPWRKVRLNTYQKCNSAQ